MINRRSFFRRSAAGISAAAFFPDIGRSRDVVWRPGARPSAIIHMVADGMSSGTFTCADYLSQLLRDRSLTWTQLMNAPGSTTALVNMRSIDSMVTDSAAASSSWGSGSRVPNGTLNLLPSGKKLLPIYALFGQNGWKRGLVTTTEITHATPAGFAASTDSRERAREIAQQYLNNRIEVLLGGGRRVFRSGTGAGVSSAFADAGYHVMDSTAELAAAPTERSWLGTFAESHLPFTIDWLANHHLQKAVPPLSLMTSRALEWLGGHEHFILQVEGGRVDHAAHNCDAASALRDMIAFDEALDVVMEFRRLRPDTLVIVTTDHGNGNMGMNGRGTDYSESSQGFAQIVDARASFPEILRLLRVSTGSRSNDQIHDGSVPDPARIREIIAETTGCRVSEERAQLFRSFLAQSGQCLYERMNSPTAQLGQLLANHTGVSWTSGSHTADYVPLTAIGPGADRCAGFIQNTDLFSIYTEFAGIDYRNPAEPLLASRDTGPRLMERTAEYARV